MCVFLLFLEPRSEVFFGAQKYFLEGLDVLFFGGLNMCFFIFFEAQK